MDVHDYARSAYRAGTGEDLLAPSRSFTGIRLAMDSKVMAMLVTALALICGLAVAWASSGPTQVHAMPAPTPVPSQIEPVTVVVYVSGEVADPGLVELEEGARVADAISDRGGLTGQADASALNLAKVVTDGEHVYVPAPGEGAPSHVASDPRVNINTASASEFEELNGIGPALAERIVAHREEIGGFTSLDQLLEVSGIGEATFEKFADEITL